MIDDSAMGGGVAMRRPATNETADIDGARPRPLRPFANRILSRHPGIFMDPAATSTAVRTAEVNVARPGSPLRCVDPTNPQYPLSWAVAVEAKRKEGKAAGAYRPASAAATGGWSSAAPAAGHEDPWRIDKLDVEDIVGKPARPLSAALRGRHTGSRCIDYSDIPRSTSAQNAGRQLNFTRRTSNKILETADIVGARPRSPSPDTLANPRNPQSPRYVYDTSSMVGTLVKDNRKTLAEWYGQFEKRGKDRLMAALAAKRESEGVLRPPSSLQTQVERPPEHPNSRDAARRRFHDHGIQRPAPRDEDRLGDDPGCVKSTHTTFAKEAKGGRGTNPADPAYSYDTRDKPVAPQRRRPASAAPTRSVMMNATVAPNSTAARRLQEEISAVRQLPNW